ncbi:conserved hypothetical protein [Burkholderia multivorans CGD1]|nr:conserved hypothetical protein [Burkholderia multivorans CGD1]
MLHGRSLGWHIVRSGGPALPAPLGAAGEPFTPGTSSRRPRGASVGPHGPTRQWPAGQAPIGSGQAVRQRRRTTARPLSRRPTCARTHRSSGNRAPSRRCRSATGRFRRMPAVRSCAPPTTDATAVTEPAMPGTCLAGPR